MTLNFPDSPFNGEKFLAQNGIEYTYNIATDTWTGALSAQNAPIDPEPGDISVTPAFGDVAPGTNPGSGTQADPYNITNAICPTLNGALTSEQTITITKGKAGDQVVFTNNTSPADISPKFTQPLGYVDANGKWTGNIVYNDSFGADTTENTTYTGNLQVGATTVFFRWQVQQQATPAMIITVGAALNGSPAVGETISCTQPAVTGGLPTYTYTYKWQTSVNNQTFSDLAGETSQDLSLSNIYTGLYVRCVATVTDSSTLQAVTLDSITPSVNVVDIAVSLSTLDPRVDEPITATATVSGGVDPVTLSYQWLADLVNIIGATSATYVVEQATADKSLRCQVTSTDGDSTNASVLSGPTNPVSAGLAPEINTVTLAEVTPNTPDRYTNQSFTTTVDMTTNNPESTFSLRGKVLGELYADTDTSVITAVGQTAVDGAWTVSPFPGDSSVNYRSIAYGDGKFVVGSGDGDATYILYSSDAKTWTKVDTPNQAFGVAYGGGKFVAVANKNNGQIMHSPDGITWTQIATTAIDDGNQGSDEPYYAVAYGDGKFIATGSSASIITSTDGGVTWSYGFLPSDCNPKTLAYGGGYWVVGGTDCNDKMFRSSDGENWFTVNVTGSTAWRAQGIAYGDGKFVAVSGAGGSQKVFYYSTDSANWTQVAPANPDPWSAVAYGGGYFVAVAEGGDNRFNYSIDGITWESSNSPLQLPYYGVAYGNDRFVAVSGPASGLQPSAVYSLSGTGSPVDKTQLTFTDTTNLSSISGGDSVVQNSGGTPETSEITSINSFVRTITDVGTLVYARGDAESLFDGSTDEGPDAGTNTSGTSITAYREVTFGIITNVTKLEVLVNNNLDGGNYAFLFCNQDQSNVFDSGLGTNGGATPTKIDVTSALGGATTLTHLSWSKNTDGAPTSISIYGVYVNDVLLEGYEFAELTFTNDTNLKNFRVGDAVQDGSVTVSLSSVTSQTGDPFAAEGGKIEAGTGDPLVVSTTYTFDEAVDTSTITKWKGGGYSVGSTYTITFVSGDGTFTTSASTATVGGWDMTNLPIGCPPTLKSFTITNDSAPNGSGTAFLGFYTQSEDFVPTGTYQEKVVVTHIDEPNDKMTVDGGKWNIEGSETYSNFLTSTTSFTSPATQAFDGSITTACYGATGSLIFEPAVPIPYSTSVRVYNFQSVSDTVSLNGGTAVTFPQDDWTTLATGSGSINNITVTDTNNSSPVLAAVEVDGVILTDAFWNQSQVWSLTGALSISTGFVERSTKLFDGDNSNGAGTGGGGALKYTFGPGAPTLSNGDVTVLQQRGVGDVTVITDQGTFTASDSGANTPTTLTGVSGQLVSIEIPGNGLGNKWFYIKLNGDQLVDTGIGGETKVTGPFVPAASGTVLKSGVEDQVGQVETSGITGVAESTNLIAYVEYYSQGGAGWISNVQVDGNNYTDSSPSTSLTSWNGSGTVLSPENAFNGNTDNQAQASSFDTNTVDGKNWITYKWTPTNPVTPTTSVTFTAYAASNKNNGLNYCVITFADGRTSIATDDLSVSGGNFNFVMSVPGDRTVLTFADATNLDKLLPGESVEQSAGYTPVTSAITNVTTATQPVWTNYMTQEGNMAGWSSRANIFNGELDSGAQLDDNYNEWNGFDMSPAISGTNIELLVRAIGSYSTEKPCIRINGSTPYTAPTDNYYWMPINETSVNSIDGTAFSGGGTFLYAIRQKESLILVDNGTNVNIELTDDINLENLREDDSLTQTDNAASGTLGSISGTTIKLQTSSSSGTWANGQTITGPALTAATGTVSSTNSTAKTLTLATSDQTPPKRWIVDQGLKVKGPVKTVEVPGPYMTLSSSSGRWLVTETDYQADLKLNKFAQASIPVQVASLFTVMGRDGQILDLTVQDPGFTSFVGNGPFTTTFPSTFPSGDAPDTALPPGTQYQMEVAATNDIGTDTAFSNKVMPIQQLADATMYGLRFDSSRATSMLGGTSGSQTTYTASCWFKYTSAAGPYQAIISNDATANKVVIGYSDPNSDYYIYDGSSVINLGFRPEANVWQNIVVSVNGTTVKGYLNGTEYNTVTTAGDMNLLNPTVGYNGVNGNVTEVIDGYLSDVYFVDGQVLEPTVFGSFFDGIWGPDNFTAVKAAIQAAKETAGGNNTSETWSDTLTASTGFYDAANSALEAFDGNTSTAAMTLDNGDTLTFTTSIDSVTKVEIWANNEGNGREFSCEATIDGVGQNAITDCGQGWKTLYDGASGTLTKVTSVNASFSGRIAAIRVNGKILVDTLNVATPGNNWSNMYVSNTGYTVGSSGDAFNGDADSELPYVSGDNMTNTITFEPTGGISGVNTFTINGGAYTGGSKINMVVTYADNTTGSFSWDTPGASYIKNIDLVALGYDTSKAGFKKIVFSVETQAGGSAPGGNWSVRQFNINGEIYVDGGFGPNGFFLPFDPAATGVNYSKTVTGNLATGSSGDPSNAFNGSLDIDYGLISTPDNGALIKWYPPSEIAANSAQVYMRSGAALAGDNASYSTDGGNTYIEIPMPVNQPDGNSSKVWATIQTAINTTNGLWFKNNASANNNPINWTAIEVSGNMLVDHNNIGVDDSGNNNDFYDQNFGVGNTSKTWSNYGNTDNMAIPWSSTYNGIIDLMSATTSFAVPNVNYGSLSDFSGLPGGGISYTTLRVYVTRQTDAPDLYVNDTALNITPYGNAAPYEYEWMTIAGPGILKNLGHYKRTVELNGASGFAYIEIDGIALINANIQDTVTDTPMLDYAVLTAGDNGNLVGDSSVTTGQLTYLGKPGTNYYFEIDGEGAILQGGGVSGDDTNTVIYPLTDTNDKVYNFGQQPFANQYNTSQAWSATSTLSTGGIAGNAFNAFNGAFYTGTDLNQLAIFGGLDGKRTATEAPFTITSSLRLYQNNGLDIPTIITFNDSQQITVTQAAGFADGNFKWYSVDLSSLTLPFSVTKMELYYDTSQSNNAIAAIEVDGKILLDSVNASQVWSNSLTSATGFQDGRGPTNAFDGVYGSDPDQGRCATTASGQTLVWQPSGLTVNDKIEVWTREGKLTVNDGAEFASSVNMGWKDLSPVSPATPFDLTKLIVTGDPSNAGEIFAIRIDGLVLVDPGLGGIATALGNYLRQTWAQYNGLAPQLSAASPENVALFNALNTKMTAYTSARQTAVTNLTTKITTLALSNTEKKVLAMSGVVPLS